MRSLKFASFALLSSALILAPVTAHSIAPAVVISVVSKGFKFISNVAQKGNDINATRDRLEHIVFSNLCISRYNLNNSNFINSIDVKFGCDYNEFSVYEALNFAKSLRGRKVTAKDLEKGFGIVTKNRFEHYENSQMLKLRIAAQLRSRAADLESEANDINEAAQKKFATRLGESFADLKDNVIESFGNTTDVINQLFSKEGRDEIFGDKSDAKGGQLNEALSDLETDKHIADEKAQLAIECAITADQLMNDVANDPVTIEMERLIQQRIWIDSYTVSSSLDQMR